MLQPYPYPSPPSSVSSSRSGSSSTRSRLSFLTVSSSSTFSDISVSSLPSPPPSAYSPSAPKTNAFFASPFPTRPPSPFKVEAEGKDKEHDKEKESKTHAFFSIPAIAIDITTPTLATQTPRWTIQSEGEPTPRPRDFEPELFLRPPPSPTIPSQPEQHVPPDPNEPAPGTLITAPDCSAYTPVPSSTAQTTTLRLCKPLGHGAFSSVWLAEDLSAVPLVLSSRRSLRDLRRRASAKSPGGALSMSVSPQPGASANGDDVMRKSSLRLLRRRVKGTRPIRSLEPPPTPTTTHDLPPSLSRASSTSSNASYNPKALTISIAEPDSPSLPSSRSASSLNAAFNASSATVTSKGRLVAVKMTVRGGPEGSVGDEEREKEKERTRVAFVREVEVLRHLSHPNITPLLTHLSTPTHHVLVLPFLPGGDLLALVNSDFAWGRLRESVLKRMWAELCRAVGWMHGVGLVHRDVKLENILLTTPVLTALDGPSDAPTLDDLPPSPAPLIKLTDFGLSRFVDIRSEEERARDRKARRAARQRARLGRAAATECVHHVQEKRGEDEVGDEEDEEDEDEDEDEGPLLSTRCGSEAYAAPELVMGGPPTPHPTPTVKLDPAPLSRKNATKTKTKAAASPLQEKRAARASGIYDARETDAWACGVV
ncbi:hypothetical protein H0H87_006340, partial [Tephrocybe sp. NHM501043]